VTGKKKRNKLRVAFRKNRQARSRNKDWSGQLGAEPGDEEEALPTEERISGKGELTRHRTIVGVETGDDGELLREVDVSKCESGRVLAAIGLNAIVESADGIEYECTVRRVLRTMSREARNVVVAGDRVLFLPAPGEQGVIERVQPRRGTLSRVSGGREHVIVSNVDQVLIVASAAEPPLKPSLIDRFLISAQKGDVHAVVCINKCDLVEPARLQPMAGLYAQLGYDVVSTSALQANGLSRLKHLLRNKETVLAGQSGVGKSSLINALEPQLGLKTSAVSQDSGKGRHTTRSARLMQLPSGGWVVDTPGIRQFELWDVQPEEVEGYFVEFRPFVPWCKFPDCTHTHETKCAVKSAVDTGLISEARYQSYRKIISGDAPDLADEEGAIPRRRGAHRT